jgi:hypothetical protein
MSGEILRDDYQKPEQAKCEGKTHLVNRLEKAEDWKRSPHIAGAIKEGKFTACRIIMHDRITTDPDQVTCARCREIIDSFGYI